MPTGDGNTVFYYFMRDGEEVIGTAEAVTTFPEAMIEIPGDQEPFYPLDFSVTCLCKLDKTKLRRFLKSVGFRGAESLFPKKHRKKRREKRKLNKYSKTIRS